MISKWLFFEFLQKFVHILCLLIPIGLCLPAYLRQGYVSDLFLSEWGSLIWIFTGFVISCMGLYLFLIRFPKKYLPQTPEIVPYKKYSVFIAYFLGFLLSAWMMGFQPSSLWIFRGAQILMGWIFACALFLVIKYNNLFDILISPLKPYSKWLRFTALLLLFTVILGASINAGYSIQWQYFIWLFVVMGLHDVWSIVIINILGMGTIFMLFTGLKLIHQHMITKSPNSSHVRKTIPIVSSMLILLIIGGIYQINAKQIDVFRSPTESAFHSHYETQTLNFSIELPAAFQDWEILYSHINGVLESNLYIDRSTRNILISHASEHFQKGWYWDTAFTALAWKNYNPEIAEKLLLDFITGAINPNGLVSHMYYPNCKSGISQPPLFAWISMELYNRTQNLSFLRKIYPLLLQAFRYWDEFRDPEHNFLYSWQTLDETGQDNTLAMGSNPVHTEAVDLSSYLAREAENIAKMAWILGFNLTSKTFSQKYMQICNAVRTYCWDAETEFFYSISKNNGSKIPVMAASGFLPLIAGIATDIQAQSLILKHLLNASEFWTPYPIPTTALSDPSFDVYYWRGPVWIPMNYLIAQGLERYNCQSIADSIYMKTISMVSNVYNIRGKDYELYHPQTGNVTDVFNPSGGMPSTNMSWNGLLNTMLIEKILGIKISGNILQIIPHLPSNWTGSTIMYTSLQFTAVFEYHGTNNLQITVTSRDPLLKYDIS